MRRWKRFIQIIVLILALGATGVLGLTVFYPVDEQLVQYKLPALPEDLEAFLQSSEASIHPKAGTEKKIFWASPDKRKTPLSLVYIHGFSATRREISPVVEEVAARIHANVFFTRLEGHGLGAAEIGRATARQWVIDTNEAFAVGRRLGEKVVLIATSTGAPLALNLAAHKDPALAGLVLISPNFRPLRKESLLGAGALGLAVTRLVLGPEGHRWQPLNPDHQYFWTTTIPPEAVHQLMELLKYANQLDLSALQLPSLWIYTENDHVVSTALIEEKFREMGGTQKKIVNTRASSHVLAGAIVSPEETGRVEGLIEDFVAPIGTRK